MQAGNVSDAFNGQTGREPEPRLMRAPHEFEGQMMKELLQPLTAGGALTGEDMAAGSGDALGEFASEALGQALSQHGGFGIADRIVKELSQSGNLHAVPQVTGNLHQNTVMRTLE